MSERTQRHIWFLRPTAQDVAHPFWLDMLTVASAIVGLGGLTGILVFPGAVSSGLGFLGLVLLLFSLHKGDDFVASL